MTSSIPSHSPARTPSLVDLNVSGENVTVLREVLTRVPGSRLARWASGAEPAPHDAQGRLFLDRDPASFRRIAQYRPGHLPVMSDTERARFMEDAAYLGLAEAIADDVAIDGMRAEIAKLPAERSRPLRYALSERLEAMGRAAAAFDLFDATAREEGGYDNEAVHRYGEDNGQDAARRMRRCVHAERCQPVRCRVEEHYALSAEALRLAPTHFESLLVRGMLLCHANGPAHFPGDDGALLPALKQSTAHATATQVAALAPLFAHLEQHPTLEPGLHAAARTLPWQVLGEASRALLALNPPQKGAASEHDRGDSGHDPRVGPTHRLARRVARWCLKVAEAQEGMQLMQEAYAACPHSAAMRYYFMRELFRHQMLQDALHDHPVCGSAGSHWIREALALFDAARPSVDTTVFLGSLVRQSSDVPMTDEVRGLFDQAKPAFEAALQLLRTKHPEQARMVEDMLAL